MLTLAILVVHRLSLLALRRYSVSPAARAVVRCRSYYAAPRRHRYCVVVLFLQIRGCRSPMVVDFGDSFPPVDAALPRYAGPLRRVAPDRGIR